MRFFLCRVLSLGRVDRTRAATAMLFAGLTVTVLLTFQDYSISNDEMVQHRYAQLIVDYYTSGLTDLSLFKLDNLYLYGGLFDLTALAIGRVIPVDIYIIRHLLCAAFGVAGIAAAFATARTIAGPRAGLWTALMLAVCGCWYGAMFNHTKDIPFAACMIGATLFMLRAARALPRPRLGDLFLFGMMTGMALGQRALGLLLLIELPLAIALCAPALPPAATMRFVGRSLLLFLPALVLAYLIMVAAWPWAGVQLFNPIRGLFAFTHFAYPIQTLLAGQVYGMGQVPRLYVPIYLAIKVPLIVTASATMALVIMVAALRSKNADEVRRGREVAFIALTAILPVVLHVVTHGPAFTGVRHFLFVVPPLAVLAGIGIERLLTQLAARSLALHRLGFICAGVWLMWTASVVIRLHPYEHLFFNPLVGGLAGADQRYDTDYWVNVMREAVDSLETYLDRERPQALPYRVAVCGEGVPFDHAAARRHRLQLAVGDENADFFIAPTHMHCDRAIDGVVVARIQRMGTVIGVVKDRRAHIETTLAGGH